MPHAKLPKKENNKYNKYNGIRAPSPHAKTPSR